MRLAGLSDRFGAEAVFGTDKRQQVAEFGGIEHNRRAKADCGTILEMDRCHGHDAIVRDFGRGGLAAQMQRQRGRPRCAAASSASIAASATFGSKATRVTQQFPGLKWGCLPAASAWAR